MERTVQLPGTAADVWSMITEGLSDWFGAEVTMEDRPGGRATFRWPDGRERGAVVEEYRPPTRFAFRWLPFERSGDRTTMLPPTRVEFEVDESEAGVSLRVVERPLRPGLSSASGAWGAR